LSVVEVICRHQSGCLTLSGSRRERKLETPAKRGLSLTATIETADLGPVQSVCPIMFRRFALFGAIPKNEPTGRAGRKVVEQPQFAPTKCNYALSSSPMRVMRKNRTGRAASFRNVCIPSREDAYSGRTPHQQSIYVSTGSACSFALPCVDSVVGKGGFLPVASNVPLFKSTATTFAPSVTRESKNSLAASCASQSQVRALTDGLPIHYKWVTEEIGVGKM